MNHKQISALGGKARAKKLTKMQRTLIARKAAKARWDEGEHEDETFIYSPIDMPMWHWKWHRFIDHLAEGKDAESFFASLKDI